MNFLAPAFLAAGAIAALVVVALHFLSTRDPKLEPFPTTRFIPEAPNTATATKLQLTDLWLLLIRALLVVLLGAALARPVLTPRRTTVTRIVAVDVSRAVGRHAELADSLRAYSANAASFIFFDSTASRVPPRAADSVRAVAEASVAQASRGSLSTAMVAALREAARLRDTADSLELVVISPFAAEELDAASLRIRQLWRGRITTVRVATAAADQSVDSVRVEWADSAGTEHWSARAPVDTIAAVRVGDAVLVHPFVRRWQVARNEAAARVLARWADGQAAALEYATATGCVRTIGFSLPTEGDALLRPDFQQFLQNIKSPCGEPRDLTPLNANVLASFQGSGSLASAAAIARRVERVTPLMSWLLGVVALLGLLEWIIRGRRGRSA